MSAMRDPSTTSSQSSRRFNIVRRLFLALILLFAVIILLNWTAWLILNPRRPVFAATSVSVSNFTLSTTSSQMEANYSLQLSVRNPNEKISLFMDDFCVFVLYEASTGGGDSETCMEMNPVYLGKMSEQSLNVTGDMAMAASEWTRRSTPVINIGVKMMAMAKFRAAKLLTKRRRMEVSCINLQGDEFIKGGRKNCSVHFVM